jgi:hypothetical protein
VADTCLLLTLEFPPHEKIRKKTEDPARKEVAGRLMAPPITLAGIKIMVARIRGDAAKTGLRLFGDANCFLCAKDTNIVSPLVSNISGHKDPKRIYRHELV